MQNNAFLVHPLRGVNCYIAECQSLIGIVHFLEADSMAKNTILNAELSCLKILRFRIALRITEFNDSMALVV